MVEKSDGSACIISHDCKIFSCFLNLNSVHIVVTEVNIYFICDNVTLAMLSTRSELPLQFAQLNHSNMNGPYRCTALSSYSTVDHSYQF